MLVKNFCRIVVPLLALSMCISFYRILTKGRRIDPKKVIQPNSKDERVEESERDFRGDRGSKSFFGSDFQPPNETVDWGNVHCWEKELEDIEDIYNYIGYMSLPCQNPVPVGGRGPPGKGYRDGVKYVCMSDKFNITPGSCLVYSFGIAADFTFDDQMDKNYNCKVHSFDPTIGLKDHDRSPNLKFHNLGISNKPSTPIQLWKCDRYVNILRQLGHFDTTIDYLKMDVEGAELAFFDDVLTNTPNLLKNVKQLAMEVHFNAGRGLRITSPIRALWSYFQRLECLGFRVWSSEQNMVRPNLFKLKGTTRSTCYEIVWARDRQW